MSSRSIHRTGRSKVKSGCRTCKIRKVKCDESWPVCHRCLSTGRPCDGYGIWGGGGNSYACRQNMTASEDSRVIVRPPVSMSILASGTDDENGCLDWFKCRTATKLPGSFLSSFWNTLLFQSLSSEPAVLNAVLALSSIHRGGIINGGGQRSIQREQEKFALQHYGKAISTLLQPQSSIMGKASFRVALITAYVFVCLELLRGHFMTAQVHLRAALKILEETQMLSNRDGGASPSTVSRDSTDDWIIEAWSRLCFQVELLQHFYQHPCLILQSSGPQTPTLELRTLKDAWAALERLLNQVLYLTHQARGQAIDICKRLRQLDHQQHIQAELMRWLDMYNEYKRINETHNSTEAAKAYQILHAYHTMATIMTATCLQPNDESAFDSHTTHFVLLIRQCIKLWTDVLPLAILDKQGSSQGMAQSIVDLGWIPPLYYAAVKCRVHRIRLQAIRLLECTSHREGFWDSNTAACVMRKVMNIEEGDIYSDIDGADQFSFLSPPCPQDLLLLPLPDSRRLREVEMVLSGAPMNKVLLYCKQTKDRVVRRILLSEYSVHLQCWKDHAT